MRVVVAAGLKALTLMPCSTRSRAAQLVKPKMPPLPAP